MSTRETETLPRPASTYQLLLDAASAWPDGIATQWIPDPADHTRCLSLTYAELAGTVTRIANALTALGVCRQDAVTLSSVNTSMLYAATLAAQAVGIAAPVNPALSGERIAELVRRTGSRVLVAAGPELDPQLWQRLAGVARQAGMTAVLALRPDDAHGEPPALRLAGDAPSGGPANGRGPVIAYLDDVIAGQPSGHLAGADLPEADDLAAFVHTGGTTGSPKVAAHTHASQLACGQGIAQCSGLAPGEADAGRAAAIPRQRPDRHRHRPDVQRRPGGVAGPRGLPRQGPVHQVLEDHRALPDRGDVGRPHRLLPSGPGPGRRRHQLTAAADRGAAPLPATVREDFAAHTGRRLLEGYGLTEATCATTWTRPGEERPGSVGRVLPGQQIKAVRPAPAGPGLTASPAGPGCWSSAGPPCSPATSPTRHRRPPGEPGGHRP